MADLLQHLKFFDAFSAIIILLTGIFAAKKITSILESQLTKKLNTHQAALIKRLVYYSVLVLFIIAALQQLGVDLGVLLGAAGVLTLALSFASQTSASNLVSGVFLLIEHPFRVGDTIKVKSFTGTVESLDLLSTKLRTSDNTLVRLPNETLIKTEIINLSHYKTRRADLLIDIVYESDIKKASELLLSLVEQNPLALKKPAVIEVVPNFKDSSVKLKLSVWAKTKELGKLKASLYTNINDAFKNSKIETLSATGDTSSER